MSEVLKESEDHPPSLQDGKDRIVFANIESIYEWHSK